jgi:hypothetical protein
MRQASQDQIKPVILASSAATGSLVVSARESHVSNFAQTLQYPQGKVKHYFRCGRPRVRSMPRAWALQHATNYKAT